MSWRPVTSGAPSHITMWARRPWKFEIIFVAVEEEVMSPWRMVQPGMGAMAWRSTLTTQGGVEELLEELLEEWLEERREARTWLQLPGAAQRSTALVASLKRSNSLSSWSSLKALRAL